ncbi:FmdB family zinc ribbon protein [Chloroflexota bacterium]
MPIYEYFCPTCNMEFELVRNFNEFTQPVFCPNCKAESQRLISNFASKTGSYLQSPQKPLKRIVSK